MATKTSDASRKRTAKDLLVLQLFFFVMFAVIFFRSDYTSFPINNIINIVMDFVAMPVLMLVLLSGLRTKTLDRTVFLFTIMIFVDTLYLFFDAMSYVTEENAQLYRVNFMARTGSLACISVISWLFWRFLCAWLEEKSHNVRRVTLGINIVSVIGLMLIIGNIFGNYYFTVSESGVYKETDVFYLGIICPVAVLVTSVIYVLQKKISITDKLIFIFYPLFPCIGSIVDYYIDAPKIVCIMVFLSNIFVYSNIFVRKDEILARRQTELAESKMNAMLLQINPHFIYNTLGSISSLCHEDPDLAEKMLFSFSNYLRNNFGEMAQKNMITIEEELEHLEFYINIEKLRFPDINVILDYKASSFKLPSLSIQPLVENAIKHGIMGRETGGTLKISTYEDKQFYYVCVEDDGVGFETLEKHDGRNHIGVKNVQKRLEILCGGTLMISSTKDVGTVSTIKIPK